MNYKKTELEIIACSSPRALLTIILHILDAIKEDESEERIGHNLIELAVTKTQMIIEKPYSTASGKKVYFLENV